MALLKRLFGQVLKDYREVQDVDASEEAQSFLAGTHPPRERTWMSRDRLRILPWLLSLVSLVVNMILWKSNADCHEHCPSLEPYSPASKVSQYVPTVFSSGDTRHHTGYQGWPDDEKDALWMDLYRYGISLAVSSSDYDKMIDTTEKMPVRGFEQDYVVGLDVFHQLHCLNMIRMGFYPGRYNTSLLKPDGTINYLQWVHVDHCIESIRQSVMCHADIATFTYRWSDKDKIMKPELGSTHICRNFTIVREYAMERNVDWQNIRAHVEDGEVVDYTNSGPHPYDDPHLEEAPEGWKYRREDLL